MSPESLRIPECQVLQINQEVTTCVVPEKRHMTRRLPEKSKLKRAWNFKRKTLPKSEALQKDQSSNYNENGLKLHDLIFNIDY